jgi:hypothetical protein
MKKVGIGVLLLFLTALSVFPAFAAKVEKGTTAPAGAGIQLPVLDPARAVFIEIGNYLPKLGMLLLILVIGSLIAVGIANLAGILLNAIKLEKGAKKVKIPEILKKGGIGLSLSDIIIEIVFFVVIIGTLITALEYYGVATNPLIGQVLSYIPNLLAAVFVLIVGILLAILISGIITLVGGNVKIAQSALLGNIAKYAIIIVSGLIALRLLGLGVVLSGSSKDIILGGIILALAISFGLGAKDKAGKFLDSILK